MLGIPLASVTKGLGGLALALSVLMVGCDRGPQPEDTIKLQVYQKWQLQPGDEVNGYSVLAGLGDLSIALNGKSIYAPFDGRAQQDSRSCLVFSSPDVPAYLFRLCGATDLKLGSHSQGDTIGSASILHIATLRKQPNGTWAIVEPSKPIIERIISKT